MPLQKSPSEQLVPGGTAACATPVVGLHVSVVQGFASSSRGAGPGVQTPAALHASIPLQAFPSEQFVPATTGTCETPVVGLHASVVHGLPSSSDGDEPAAQVPAPLQVSVPLHALPSEQLVPAATGA